MLKDDIIIIGAHKMKHIIKRKKKSTTTTTTSNPNSTRPTLNAGFHTASKWIQSIILKYFDI